MSIKPKLTRLPYRATTWIVFAFIWMLIDLASPSRIMLCVLHAAMLPLALRLVPPRRSTLVATGTLAAASLPWLLRSILPALGIYVTRPVPLQGLEYVRIWTIVAITSITIYNFDQLRIRRKRLIGRRALYRRVRRRTKQLRSAIELLKRESAQRQSAQQKLAESESHLQSLMRHARMHLLRKDKSGLFTYVSPTFCELIQQDADWIIGKSDFDLYPERTALQYREDDLRVMQTGEPYEAVEVNPQADGKHTYVQVLKVPEYDDAGEVIGTQAVFWDVTDRWRSVLELRRSEMRKRALFESAADGILLVGANAKIVEANPAASRILRLPIESLADRDLTETLQPTGVAAPWTRKPLGIRRETQLRRSPVSEQVEASQTAALPVGPSTSDSEVFPAELSAHPIPLDDGIGTAIFIRDITTRHRAQEELREAKDMAERASKAKSDFLAGVSHEIRTPLGGILGLSQLLAESPLSLRQRAHVDMICQSADLLHGVIEDILDFSRIEAGAVELDKVAFDLQECVGQAFKCLAARAVGKGIEMIFLPAADLHRSVVGDPIRLRQIIVNLAGNAIKFTDQGEVFVSVSSTDQVHESDGDLRHYVIEVKDSGIGIPVDRQNAIFEAFQQADSSTTRRFGGTGLGLAIAQRIANAMHGNIEVESQVDCGSTFRCHVWLATNREATRVLPASRSKGMLTASDDASLPGDAVRIEICTESDHLFNSLVSGLRALDAVPRRIEVPFGAGQPTANALGEGEDSIRVLILDASTFSGEHGDSVQPTEDHPVIWLCDLGATAPAQAKSWHPQLIKPVLPDEIIAAVTRFTSADRADGDRADGDRADGDLQSITGISEADSSEPNENNRSVGNLSQLTLLLVDDSPVNRTVIRELLASTGIHVDTVVNGLQAVQQAQLRSYDLVLMDLQMPEMDGPTASMEIGDALRRKGVTPPAIIALTAHVTDQHRQTCLDAGMVDFLTKPVRRAELIATLLRHAPSEIARLSSPEREMQPNSAIGSEEAKPMDAWVQHFTEAMGQPLELFPTMVQAFLIEVPETVRALEDAASRKDTKAVRRAAHTLKSCLRYVTDGEEVQIASKVERLAKDDQLEGLDVMIESLHRFSSQWCQRLSAPTNAG